MTDASSNVSSALRFRVQWHAARRLHYDLRLELDGTLVSWAVTRGPSLDPRERRLAIRVADHGLDYADFEGVIAEGYGAGTVMLWDRGTWEPEGDPRAGLRDGRLRFALAGERMRGGWSLTRMNGQRRESWLLHKRADAFVGGADDLTDGGLTSIASGRTLAEIADGAPIAAP